MKRMSIVLLGATALSLSACGSRKNATVAAPDATANAAATETSAPALAPGQEFANTAAASDAFEHDLELLQLAVAAGELGGPLPSTGSVGVAHGVHALGLYEGI